MEPEPLDWAARYTLGWFPLDMTGFRKVKHVGAGVRLRIHAGGIERTTTEVVSSWVRPEPMSKTDCIDLARESLLDMTDAAMELWTRPSVGLSGGWDSRMVAACLLHRGSDMELRVRGNPQRLDVLIAQELAAIVDRPIRAKITSGLPPEEVGSCRDAMLKALTWQAGGFPTKKHKTFLVRKPLLDGGVVNVMGQHGGIGKADFAVKIGAHELAPEDYEDALVAQLMKDCPIFLRTRWKDQIEDVIRRAYRAADAYGLEGLARLHFFFLNEYTRRWGAASINSQSGVVFAPILSTGFMRAAYAYPGEELPTKPFHREVTRQLAPFWEGIPYDSTPGARDRYAAAIASAEAALPPEEASDKNWKKQRQWSKYDNRRYWKYVGKSLFQEAVRERGFVKDLFERATAKELVFEKGHQTTADMVVLTYLLGEVYSGLVPGPMTGPPSDN